MRSIFSAQLFLALARRKATSFCAAETPNLKKEIIDAWVEEWHRMNRSKATEASIIANITSLLPQLSEDGPRRVQAEVNTALSH